MPYRLHAAPTKNTDYCFIVENIDDYSEYTFFVFFDGDPMMYRVLRGNVCETFFRTQKPKLYAVRTIDVDLQAIGATPARWKQYFETDAHVRDIAVDLMLSSVERESPVVKIMDIMRITSVDSTTCIITKRAVKYFYSDGTTQEMPYVDQLIRPTTVYHARSFHSWIWPTGVWIVIGLFLVWIKIFWNKKNTI